MDSSTTHGVLPAFTFILRPLSLDLPSTCTHLAVLMWQSVQQGRLALSWDLLFGLPLSLLAVPAPM